MINKNDLIPIIQEINQREVDVFYKDEQNNIYAFPTELCRFVGYRQANTKASDVYRNNKEILKTFQGMCKTHTPSGVQETRYLMNEGIHFFIMELGSDDAKLLKMGYSRLVERYRKQEFPLVKQPNTQDLLKMSENIMLAAQSLITAREEDRQLITEVNNKATKAFKIASYVQHKFIESAKNEARRKRVWELKHVLAEELSKYVSLKSAHWRVITRLRKKYQFYKFEKMSPHFYDDAIEWLKYKIKHAKKLKGIPPPFRNNDDLKELKKEELPQKPTTLDELL